MKFIKPIHIINGIVLIFFVLAAGCATRFEIPPPPVTTAPLPPPTQADYRIQSGDELAVKFYYNPELNDSLVVRPDGKISLQLIDDVYAAGLTPDQLDATLTQKYSGELKQPLVSVVVKSFSRQRVFVGGEVNSQGSVYLTPGMTPFHAVLNAGGLKETAKLEDLIIIRRGANNRPRPIRVNLNDALYGKRELASLQLQPFDIVYVPKSKIAKINKFVDQYVQNLLLFNGWGIGISSEPDGFN